MVCTTNKQRGLEGIAKILQKNVRGIKIPKYFFADCERRELIALDPEVFGIVKNEPGGQFSVLKVAPKALLSEGQGWPSLGLAIARGGAGMAEGRCFCVRGTAKKQVIHRELGLYLVYIYIISCL